MPINELHKRYLHAMGIQTWELRQAESPVPLDKKKSIPSDAAADIIEIERPLKIPAISEMGWERLQETVLACQKCVLHETRTQAVFGVGDHHAHWMIIGEAPGADEDRQGEPFVGRAGQLLNNMLLALGLKREEVYIANVLKCRPPGNRDPKSEEVEQCEKYLERQVELIKPKIILAVGRIAAQNLLKTDNSLARLRNQAFHYGSLEIPLVVTYHPAYLLRSPSEKRKAWQDLQFAMQLYRSQQAKNSI